MTDAEIKKYTYFANESTEKYEAFVNDFKNLKKGENTSDENFRSNAKDSERVKSSKKPV